MEQMIKIFEDEEFGRVRTVIKDGEPWLVGKDVAVILVYAKPENAIAAHVDSEDKTSTLNQERYNESPEIKLSVGDILLVKDGAGIGKCARIDDMPYGESAPNGSLAVITPRDFLEYRYLYYFLLSNEFKENMNRILTGMGVPHLTQHFLKDVEVPIPNYSEQVRIADILDKQLEKLDALFKNINAQIEALQEFKTRLISDVVTGKIDVRGIEIPKYQYTEEVNDIVDVNEQED